MNEYELICIIKPDLQASRLEKINEKIKKVLDEGKGKILDQKDWGKRKLAYTIGKENYGQYLYFTINSGGEQISNLERVIKYEEDVMRFLTVKLDPIDPKAPADIPQRITTLEEARVEEGDFWGEPINEY